ncbi:hypothetical protein AB0J98_07085 [Micromonospora coxensis]
MSSSSRRRDSGPVEERPFDIGVVYVHSANPAGAEKIMQALRRWGYHVRSAAGSPHLGYLAEAE